jgi:hypothetical protein
MAWLQDHQLFPINDNYVEGEEYQRIGTDLLTKYAGMSYKLALFDLRQPDVQEKRIKCGPSVELRPLSLS